MSDPGGGGGGTGTQPPPADPTEGFKRLLDKQGGEALRLAEQLYGENYREREQHRVTRTELDALRAKLPAEGSAVLTAEERAAWEAYRTLGDVDALKTALDERTRLATDLSARDRRETIRTAAAAAGYDPDVLAQLAGDLPITVREVGEGKDRRAVAYVTADGKETQLDKYATATWAKFLPALAPTKRGDGLGTGTTGTRPAQPAELSQTPRARF